MHYLELHSVDIVVVSLILSIISLVELVIFGSRGREKIFSIATYVCLFSFVLFVEFNVLFWTLSADYNNLISTQPANILKVQTISPSGADVTYSVNGVLKDDQYTGSVKLNTLIQKPTAEIETRKNIFGAQENILSNLVVPESYIK